MSIFKTITKPIRKAWEAHQRRVNRPYMEVDFSESVSRQDLIDIANTAVGTIKGKKIDVSTHEASVRGLVVSNTGLSTWMFKIDFNDYGHITGRYWLSSENNDSPIPQVIAERMKDLIEIQIDGADLIVESDEYFCPNCNAVLNNQEGFSPEKQSWICKRCGQQLIGDDLNSDVFGDVVWYCDNCGSVLNRQEGFTEENGVWECKECGCENDVTEGNIKKGHHFH